MALREKLFLIILTGFVYYAGLGHQQTKHSHRFLFYAARMINAATVVMCIKVKTGQTIDRSRNPYIHLCNLFFLRNFKSKYLSMAFISY